MAGRPKNIESPGLMWELFTAYKKATKEQPIKQHIFVGKDGNSEYLRLERALTMEGFQNYLDDLDIITDVTDYFENKEGRYAEFVRICSRVRRTIKQDQIEGGMAGIYNPSITQRLNGLVDQKASDDKQDVTIRVKYDRKGNNPGGATQQPIEGAE